MSMPQDGFGRWSDPADDEITGYPDHYIVNGDTTWCPCVEHTRESYGTAYENGSIEFEVIGTTSPDSLVLSQDTIFVNEEVEPINWSDLTNGFEVMVDAMQTMRDTIAGLRVSHPSLFEDIDPQEYEPYVSGDAMRVQYRDDMEDRPLW